MKHGFTPVMPGPRWVRTGEKGGGGGGGGEAFEEILALCWLYHT